MDREADLHLLRQGRSSGVVDLILRKLDEEFDSASAPIDPSDVKNWQDKRAWNDGAAAMASKLYKWLDIRSREPKDRNSPDGAENTED